MHALQRAHLTLLPPACWGCGRLLGRPAAWGGRAPEPPGYPYLCESCHAELPRLETAGAGAGAPIEGVARVWAACRYEAPVRDWVQRFKYGRRDGLLRLLGTLLHAATDTAPEGDGPAADAVVPVPLHPWRLWQRGFNQSLLLAHAWRRAAGPADGAGGIPPLAPRVLVRHRYTRPQVRMSAEERRVNVADAFSLHPGLRGTPRPLEGRRLLLVDDVATTGATLTACAGVLRAAGAARVEALLVARA